MEAELTRNMEAALTRQMEAERTRRRSVFCLIFLRQFRETFSSDIGAKIFTTFLHIFQQIFIEVLMILQSPFGDRAFASISY